MSITLTSSTSVFQTTEIGDLLVYEKGDFRTVQFLDPILSQILLDLGMQLAESLGAKAIGKLFGSSSSPNLEKLLARLVADIADIVREIVDTAAIRNASSFVQYSVRLLSEYAQSPETVPGRLEQALFQSGRAVEELKAMLPTSAAAYVLGVYTHISALQEIALKTESDAEANNLRKFALESAAFVESAVGSLIDRSRARVGSVTMRTYKESTSPLIGDEESDTGKKGSGSQRKGNQGFEIKHYVTQYPYDGSIKSWDCLKERDAWIMANSQNALDREKVEGEFQVAYGALLSKANSIIQTLGNWIRPTA